MIRVAICDNENLGIGQIERLLNEINRKNEIVMLTSCYYGQDDLEKGFVKGNEFDLFYLNIQNESTKGIELGKYIRKRNENAVIIFVSNDKDYVFDVLDSSIGILNFFTEPIDNVRFEKAFLDSCKIVEDMNDNKDYFTYRYGKWNKNEKLKSIMYFKSNARVIEIHLKDGQIRTYNGKINDVETMMVSKKEHFVRSHQSFFINLMWIEEFSRTEIKMRNGEVLPISDERREKFRKECNRLFAEK